jgi:hypothetical protein
MAMFNIRGEHSAMTERSPAYAILAIDSEDRFRDYTESLAAAVGGFNDSPYDFQITKNESMMNGFFTRLALTEINFPWAIPNINPTTRQIIVQYQVGAGPIQSATIALVTAFYSPSALATALQVAIRAVDPVLNAVTVTYGTTNEPFFAYQTNVAGTTMAFQPLPYNSIAYPYPATTKQLFYLLGFRDVNTVLAATAGGLYTFCQAIRYIDIVCNQLTYNQALKDTMSQTVARDTLCRLYLGDGPYTGTSTVNPSDPDFCPPGCAPFTIYRQFTNPKFIRWLPNQPVQGNLRFEVFDDNGVSLTRMLSDFFNSRDMNWSMTLLVSED